MPKIELRSEKVRVLIGAVPPSLIRYGNICLMILLMILFILANIIKLPNNMECDVIAQEGSDQSLFLLV